MGERQKGGGEGYKLLSVLFPAFTFLTTKGKPRGFFKTHLRTSKVLL